MSRYLTGLAAARKKVDSVDEYRLWFDLVAKKTAQYEVQPHNVYSMDEKGFLIGMLSKVKRIFTKQAYESKRLLGNVQDGNREWITAIATICADGTALAPALIYKAVSGDIQDRILIRSATQPSSRHQQLDGPTTSSATSDLQRYLTVVARLRLATAVIGDYCMLTATAVILT